VPAPNAPSFIAADRRSGKLLWSSNAPGERLIYTWSSPVLWRRVSDTCIIFPGSDGCLYAKDALSHRTLWSLDCNHAEATAWTRIQRGTRNFFVSTPTVSGNVLYVGLYQDTEASLSGPPLLAINLELAHLGMSKALKWEFKNQAFQVRWSSVAVADGILFAVSESSSRLFAIDCESGEEVWGDELIDGTAGCFGGPYVCDDYLYVPSASMVRVYKVGARRKNMALYQYPSRVNGTLMMVGKTLFVTTRGALYATDARHLSVDGMK
jgi:outer membrane protein assembly factor BamB